MPSIGEIDKFTIETIRDRVLSELSSLGEDLGISFSLGRSTYDSKHVELKLNCATIEEDGTVNTIEAREFIRYQQVHGINPDRLGTVFILRNRRYTLMGYKPKNRKFPIIAETNMGSRYKLPLESVRAALDEAETLAN